MVQLKAYVLINHKSTPQCVVHLNDLILKRITASAPKRYIAGQRHPEYHSHDEAIPV